METILNALPALYVFVLMVIVFFKILISEGNGMETILNALPALCVFVLMMVVFFFGVRIFSWLYDTVVCFLGVPDESEEERKINQ